MLEQLDSIGFQCACQAQLVSRARILEAFKSFYHTIRNPSADDGGS